MRSDRTFRTRRVVAGLASCASALALVGAWTAPASAAQGQVLGLGHPDAVAGSYIVKFKDSSVDRAGVSSAADRLAARFSGKVTHKYDVIRGFAVELSEAQAKQLAADPTVEFVQQDRVYQAVDTQTNPTWGLDRVDQTSLPVDSKYTYPSTAGQGVTAYIIDSGIKASHSEFTGRIKTGKDFIDGDTNPDDCNSHGTHVAGTVAGTTYGVAKKANIVAVRILKCDGYTQGSSWLDGMNWVAANAVKPAVANMSIGGAKGGGGDSSVDAAIKKMIDAGVTVAVAAGNFNEDACQQTGRYGPALTVAASDGQDKRSIWGTGLESNWGSCIDLFAPGSNITSADSNNAPNGTKQMGGTSMATPHVAGAAALYLSLSGNSGKTPAEVHKALVDNATTGKITDIKGSPNRLLNVTFMNGGGPEPGPCSTASSTEDKAIPDAGSAVSTSVNVSNCSGGGTSATQVKVDIIHPYTGDLKIELVGPSGKTFLLQAARGASSADGVHKTFSVDTSSETARNGSWKLQVTDTMAYDTGNIDGWSLTF